MYLSVKYLQNYADQSLLIILIATQSNLKHAIELLLTLGGKILKIEHKNRCEHAGGSEQPSSSESRPQQLAQQDLRYAKSYVSD